MTGRAPTAFVTGGTGFVGSHLVEALLAHGYGEVRCLVRADRKWLDGLDVTIVPGTLDDQSALERGVEGADYVYHVAGLTRAPTLAPLIEANVVGTMNLMRAIETTNPALKKVLITSSLAVIGSAETVVADESTPMSPISRYGKSKARMERILRSDGWLDRLPVVIVRPPAVYGPRDSDILDFFKTVNRGLSPVVGSGTQFALSLIHVRDLAQGMILAAEAPVTAGELFFIGSEEFYSWHALRDAAAVALGRRVVTVHVPPRAVPAVGAVSELWGWLTRSYPPLNREKAAEIMKAVKMCSVEKAMSRLGFRQRIDLESGVAETIDWYRAEGLL
jgi:nucleoside-diphosphate-sugar epimerase